jgi:hypothetical protein
MKRKAHQIPLHNRRPRKLLRQKGMLVHDTAKEKVYTESEVEHLLKECREYYEKHILEKPQGDYFS